MSGVVETEAPRPRPLSGGLWTLFSWLRRDERSSSESLSSAGSDRTAASFAFLAPAHYDTASPARLPPPGPPTDSYKKRLRDRNLRRQHERDITLHRKYGLYGFGYDSLNLPIGRRVAAASGDRCERDRRAASESPRAHVPGKRRAPLPPTAAATATLTRRRAKKRPAPPPPLDLANKTPENTDKDSANIDNKVPMSQLPLRDKKHDNASGCKPEKYSKKDTEAKETKDIKVRHEKSFLKQIFDSRKRNSAIETASVKLLPNISELDKQAAEIIEKYRLKEMVRNDSKDKEVGINESPGSSKLQTEAWICTRCLRKYNATVITCNYCLPLNKVNVNDSYNGSKLSNNSTQTSNISASSKGKMEDKEKLKEILKEMKDSLPKRPKNDIISLSKQKNANEIEDYPKIVEAPTLRIGSPISTEERHHIAQTSITAHLDKDPPRQIVNQEMKKDQKENIHNPRNSFMSSILEKEALANKLVSQDINKKLRETNAFRNNTDQGASSSKLVMNENKKELAPINSVLITQPVVLVHSKESNVVLNKTNVNKEELVKLISIKDSGKSVIDNTNKNINQKDKKSNEINDPKPLNIISKAKYDLNTPLKISSLLNPIYVPKTPTSVNMQATPVLESDINVRAQQSTHTSSKNDTQAVRSPEPCVPQIKSTTSNSSPERKDQQVSEQKVKVENKEPESNQRVTQIKTEVIKPLEVKTNSNLATFEDKPSTSNEGRLNQHTRRRDLINQLERSIAKGDEHAAAEAAVKLAQLRLSCSVLSFSSQIVAEAPVTAEPQQMNASKTVNEIETKAEEAIQKSSQVNIEPVKVSGEKQLTEHNALPKVDANNDKEKSPRNNKEDIKTKKIDTHGNVLSTTEPSNKSKYNCETKDAVTQKTVQCKASTSKGVTTKENVSEEVPILVWVEDKEATRGPVQIHVRRNAVMGDLRRQAEQSLGLNARMQRWIVGRSLCTDDKTPLLTLAGTALTAPFYLCLVESESKETVQPNIDLKLNEDAGNVYNELVKLEHQAIVSNAEVFECGVCIEECPPGNGVVLRECVHSFCRECLSDVVRHSEEPVVACPAMGCRGVLQEREIRGLVLPEDYEKWLARGLAAAESGTRNAFHCRTRDCTGWALCDPGVRRFPCPVCKRTNCVPCQAIHEGETCEQHRAKLQQSAASPGAGQTDEGTRALLDNLISRGEALECPECSAIITKKWGCDWVKCSACKTEICWVTKGRRWGPAGRGDTSAGCRCGVDGKRCHPSCGYCH